MKTMLKLVAVAVAVLGMTSAANAFSITYLLDPVSTPGSWTLYAKTDAPGGIAAAVVNLTGATTGSSNAPRTGVGSTALAGFKLGNLGSSGSPNWGSSAASQAFAGQDTGDSTSVAFGLGFKDVPLSAFAGGALPFIGGSSGTRVSVPAFVEDPNGWLKMYSGTGTPAYAASQSQDSGAIWTVENQNPITPIGFAGGTTFAYKTVVPEPGTIVLFGLAVPALALAIRRRYA